jgi:hypothetical protein
MHAKMHAKMNQSRLLNISGIYIKDVIDDLLWSMDLAMHYSCYYILTKLYKSDYLLGERSPKIHEHLKTVNNRMVEESLRMKKNGEKMHSKLMEGLEVVECMLLDDIDTLMNSGKLI